MDKLYQLNKDELVKLVYTIQIEIEKKYQRKLRRLQEEYDFTKETIYRHELVRCFDDNCNAMCCPFYDRESEYRNCTSLESCQHCFEYFCNIHGDIQNNICSLCKQAGL